MKKFLVFILPLIFFISCSSAPKQSNYALTLQPKMQAARHWHLLAQNFSIKVAEVLKDKQSFSIAESSLTGHVPVYIDKRDQSVFGKAFRTMLITELWKYDIEIVDNPESAYSISWGSQKIYHKSDRYDIFPGLPMFIGEAVAYVLVGGDHNPGKPHWEVMITLNLHTKENQLLRQTGIKYVNDEDIRHYDDIADLFIKPVIKHKPALVTYVVVGK